MRIATTLLFVLGAIITLENLPALSLLFGAIGLIVIHLDDIQRRLAR